MESIQRKGPTAMGKGRGGGGGLEWRGEGCYRTLAPTFVKTFGEAVSWGHVGVLRAIVHEEQEDSCMSQYMRSRRIHACHRDP